MEQQQQIFLAANFAANWESKSARSSHMYILVQDMTLMTDVPARTVADKIWRLFKESEIIYLSIRKLALQPGFEGYLRFTNPRTDSKIRSELEKAFSKDFTLLAIKSAKSDCMDSFLKPDESSYQLGSAPLTKSENFNNRTQKNFTIWDNLGMRRLVQPFSSDKTRDMKQSSSSVDKQSIPEGIARQN